jgi:hypothetical protein
MMLLSFLSHRKPLFLAGCILESDIGQDMNVFPEFFDSRAEDIIPRAPISSSFMYDSHHYDKDTERI